MKKILFVCQYAQEPPLNNMLRYHNFGKELVKRGWDVTIAASSKIHNTTIDAIGVLGKSESVVDGVKYKYVKTNSYQGNGLKRVLNMFNYCRGIKKLAKLDPDIVVVCGAYAYRNTKKAFKNKPIVLDILDLWPQSMVEYANKSPNHPFIKYMYRVEKKAYINSDAIIFSMEGGKDYVRERKYSSKVAQSKIFHINMGCDIKQIDSNRKANETELTFDDRLLHIGYCGSIRQANNVKQICDVAAKIKEEGYKNVFFDIFGNGDELDNLIEYCKDNDIDNIKFYGRIEKEKIHSILSKMSANIITYKQVNLMKYGGSQSKLFDYLSVGKPIICNCNFGYNLITRYNCGLVTKSQETNDFADTITEMILLSDEQKQKMGTNARKTAEMYDVKILTDQLLKVFEYIDKK